MKTMKEIKHCLNFHAKTLKMVDKGESAEGKVCAFEHTISQIKRVEKKYGIHKEVALKLIVDFVETNINFWKHYTENDEYSTGKVIGFKFIKNYLQENET